MPHKSKEGEKSMSEAKKLLQRMQASCDDFYSVDLEDDSSVNTLVCALYW
jgi:hypothetical protein